MRLDKRPMVDYTIICEPFMCPVCKTYVKVDFEEAEFWTGRYSDGGIIHCPNCGGRIEIRKL